MVNFVVFTVTIALIFCITSIFLERVIPLKKSEILVITIISLFMLGLFPYLSSVFTVYKIFLIYILFVILCAATFYFFYKYKHTGTSPDIQPQTEIYSLPAAQETTASPQDNYQIQTLPLESQTYDPETTSHTLINTIIEEKQSREKSGAHQTIPKLPGPKEVKLLESPAEENFKHIFHNLHDYIDYGFKKRKAGELSFAVDCFIKAMQHTKNTELNVKLGLEVSAIYRQMGMNWQALELLKAINHTCEKFLEPGMANELKTNIELLENEIHK